MNSFTIDASPGKLGLHSRRPLTPVNAPPPAFRHRPPMPDAIVHLDARGLEPPQPLVAILEALESLPAGTALEARTDRNPVHLHAVVAHRGFTAETRPAPPPEPGFITRLRHAN